MEKKITISKSQATDFNFMRQTLIAIHKGYETPEKLRRNCEKDYGLDFEEAIEMAYDNIQIAAKSCVRGVKPIIIPD